MRNGISMLLYAVLIKLILILQFIPGTLFSLNKTNIKFYKNELSVLESKMLEDSEDTKFDEMSIVDAYCIATGITNRAVFLKIQEKYKTNLNKLSKSLDLNKSKYSLANDICQGMHKYFFTQYEYNSIFPIPLIYEGKYNCITSAVIYADLLKKNNINYKYGFVSGHVFVYVILDEKTILCETTNPIGFDPGVNFITNDDGSMRYTTKVNYANVKQRNDTEFISFIYYDHRILSKNSSTDYYNRYLLTKKGLYINPGDDILRLNFIAYSYMYIEAILLSNEIDHAEEVAIDSIKIIKEFGSNPEEILYTVSRIVQYRIEKEQFNEAEEFLNVIMQVSSRNNYNSIIDDAYNIMAYKFVSEDKANEGLNVVEHGLKLNPGSVKLENRKREIKVQIADSELDIDKICNEYRDLIGVSPNADKIKKRYLIKLSELLSRALELNRIEYVNKYVKIFNNDCGKDYGDKLVNHIYGNTIHKYSKSGLFSKAVSIGKAGLKWKQDGIIFNNYMAVLPKYISSIYETRGLNSAFNMLENEISGPEAGESVKMNSAKIMHDSIYKHMVSGSTNNVNIVLNKIKTVCGDVSLYYILDNTFINIIYDLIQKKEYRQAMLAGQIAFGFGEIPALYNNYMVSVQEYLENHIRQKDIQGAISILGREINEYPFITDLHELPVRIFRPALGDLLKSGNFNKFNTYINEMAKFIEHDKFNQFKNIIYINTSYELIKENKFFQASYIAERGYSESSLEKIFNNLRSSTYKGFHNVIENISSSSIFKRYSGLIKKFPDKVKLKTDLSGLITQQCINFLVTGRITDADNNLNILKKYVDSNIFNSDVEKIYQNASYTVSKNGHIKEAFRITEIGLKWTRGEKLVVNYMSLLYKNVSVLLKEGNNKEAESVLKKAKKEFPNHPQILKVEKLFND